MAKPTVRNIDPSEPVPQDESPDDKIVREAKKRFKRVAEWEATSRKRWLDDVKFCNGDADNLFQWPDNVRDARAYGTSDERPCLTINKTQQHVFQIVNDGRQNKSSVKIKPVGDEATYEAAQVLEGLVRHIEYVSDAQSIYTHVSTGQVQGGIGYCRMVTDYVDDVSFDQEIYIKPLDALTVYGDPDSKEADGSDWRFAFVFTDVPRDEFVIQYPDVDIPLTTTTALGNDEGAWVGLDMVRVAEYYYRTEVPDLLIVFTDPMTGEKKPIKKSETKGFSGALREALDEQLEDPDTQTRDIIGHEVKWVKIAGNQIIDRKDWAGSRIPIYFAEGIKTVIDGELDRKGHVRALKDPQRMYNYFNSAAVEYSGLQSKTPWLAASQSIEGLETYWGRANLDNNAVLPFNHKDDDGQPIPPPERMQPPVSAPAYMAGMQTASTDMMLVSGQYQPMMGEPSNERSGKAITARQRQGENSTYHFIDNLATMIRRIGKDIIEIVPKIYDTPRLVKIMGDDLQMSDVMIDPTAKMAFEKRKSTDRNAAEQVVMNPSVGRYDVMSDTGPDFATRRQESFNALSQIAASNPELMGIIGDLVMLAADFPLADEAAERLKRMVPAQALGDGPNPQIMALEKQLQAMQNLVSALSTKAQAATAKTITSESKREIEEFRAVTDRMKVVFDHFGIPADMQLKMMHDLALQEHAAQLGLVDSANDALLSQTVRDNQAA